MPPGPLKDFSMNLFLAKQVHHLLGLPSAVSKTFSHTLWPKNVELYNVFVETFPSHLFRVWAAENIVL